jgi:hypothetical protein
MLRSVDGYTVSGIIYWENVSFRLQIITSLKYIRNEKIIQIKIIILRHVYVPVSPCPYLRAVGVFRKFCRVYFERRESQFMHPTTLVLYT